MGNDIDTNTTDLKRAMAILDGRMQPVELQSAMSVALESFISSGEYWTPMELIDCLLHGTAVDLICLLGGEEAVSAICHIVDTETADYDTDELEEIPDEREALFR